MSRKESPIIIFFTVQKWSLQNQRIRSPSRVQSVHATIHPPPPRLARVLTSPRGSDRAAGWDSSSRTPSLSPCWSWSCPCRTPTAARPSAARRMCTPFPRYSSCHGESSLITGRLLTETRGMLEGRVHTASVGGILFACFVMWFGGWFGSDE